MASENLNHSTWLALALIWIAPIAIGTFLYLSRWPQRLFERLKNRTQALGQALPEIPVPRTPLAERQFSARHAHKVAALSDTEAMPENLPSNVISIASKRPGLTGRWKDPYRVTIH